MIEKVFPFKLFFVPVVIKIDVTIIQTVTTYNDTIF